ncbi:Transcription factor, K-box [Corchorus capsularis]|uniref:Transcription factor, K-box n=1 Tax=Corchorus capsularis TaxID=210143 RepID=A0A1R3JYC9_COCAP|nr:Transcription factor, K-box [Corchorus capsularis]
MEGILERYERQAFAERQVGPSTPSESQGNWSLECPKLMATIEALQRNLRNFMGEELDPLSLRDLQLLEHQIDTSLKRIRIRKNQLMNESISVLQKKERALQDQNNMLAKKLKEDEKTQAENAQPEQHELAQSSSSFIPPLSPPAATIQFPSLAIGLNSCRGTSQATEGANKEADTQLQPSSNTVIPPWMLRPVNR